MRNIKSKKGKIAIGALVVGFLIIINTILVQKTTYITLLEDQFCVIDLQSMRSVEIIGTS